MTKTCTLQHHEKVIPLMRKWFRKALWHQVSCSISYLPNQKAIDCVKPLLGLSLSKSPLLWSSLKLQHMPTKNNSSTQSLFPLNCIDLRLKRLQSVHIICVWPAHRSRLTDNQKVYRNCHAPSDDSDWSTTWSFALIVSSHSFEHSRHIKQQTWKDKLKTTSFIQSQFW